MKNKKPILFINALVILFSISMNSGCKKEKDTTDLCTDGIQNQNETGVDCGNSCNTCTASAFRIKTITYFDGSVSAYSYDNQGRVTSLAITSTTSGNSNQQYTYGTNSVTQILQDGSTINYTLNSNGYATSQVFKDNIGAVIFSLNNTYDNEGHLLSSGSNGGGTITNTWTDGNLTSDNNFGGQTYTYLSTKDNTIGNENKGMKFLGKDSKNLRSTSTSYGSTTTFTYEYDSQNRVTKQMNGGLDAIVYTYY
jgi:hypothetical protein